MAGGGAVCSGGSHLGEVKVATTRATRRPAGFVQPAHPRVVQELNKCDRQTFKQINTTNVNDH